MDFQSPVLKFTPIMGCLVVVCLAMCSAMFQAWLYIRSREKRFHGWGACLSFATAIFSTVSLIQFLNPSDQAALLCEKIQFCTFPVMSYCLWGFSNRFFNIRNSRMDRGFTILTGFMILLVWIPDLIVTDEIKEMVLLGNLYREPRVGQLGTLFVAVSYLAAVSTTLIWLWHLTRDRIRTIPYLIGFTIWAATALHDALATFGMPFSLYLMSYGVLGFNIAVIWTTTEDYLSLKAKLEAYSEDLERLVAHRTASLEERNQELKETIEQLHQTQEELHHSNRFLRRLGRTAGIGGWELDIATGKLRLTDEIIRIQGLSGDNDFGLETLLHFLPPHDRDQWEKALKDCMEQGTLIDEKLQVHSQKGVYLWVHVICQPLMENGRTVKLVGTIQDITERVRIDEQLRQSRKMESIGNLAGGIAHDFNNILSSIIGYSELALMQVAEDSAVNGHLREVLSAGNRAADLVKQILAFARQSNEELKPVRLDQIVREALRLIRSTAPASIEIISSLNSGDMVLGNPTQLFQVLINLCTNAVHAMEHTGGILEITLTNVSIDDGSENPLPELDHDRYIKVTVADSGTGIEPDILESIFDPYFTTKNVGKGTGMGLAMVHGIVEGYHGKITVKSQVGQGTTFSIYLPTVQGKRDGLPVPEPALPKGDARILLVDDEFPIVRMNSLVLEALGYKVTRRTSSIEALEVFRAKPYDFDLVITDMTMPNMNGDVLAMEILSLRPDIPIILLTGYSRTISEERACAIGIRSFAYKPIGKVELANRVHTVLKDC